MSARLRCLFPGALLLGLFAVAIVIARLPQEPNSWAWNDARDFHLPQIARFMAHPFDLLHYPASAATTPGYHIVVAWLLDLTGRGTPDEANGRLVFINAMIGCLPVLIAWATILRLCGGPWTAAALAAPVAASSYVISSAAFPTTDNAALALYALSLYLLLFHRRKIAPLAATLAGLVAIRQMYLPVAGAFVCAAFDDFRQGPLVCKLHPVMLAKGVAICLPAIVLYGAWAAAWGGLVPVEFRSFNTATLSWSVPIQGLALCGLYAFFFALPGWSGLQGLGGPKILRIVAASLVPVLPLWLAGPTDFDWNNGRWGSVIWTLAAHTPAIHGHSLIVLVLAWAGMSILGLMAVHSRRESCFPAELLLLLFYFIGYSAQIFAWQRYVEPHIFLTLAVFVARLRQTRPWFALAPLGLAVASATASLLHIAGHF